MDNNLPNEKDFLKKLDYIHFCAACGRLPKWDFESLIEIRDTCNMIRNQMSYRFPKTITHEASLYSVKTCPTCSNVVSENTTFGTSEIAVVPPFCKFCGQALEDDNPHKILRKKWDYPSTKTSAKL